MAPPLSAALSTEEVCKPPRGVWSVQHSGLLILWSSLLLERWLRESVLSLGLKFSLMTSQSALWQVSQLLPRRSQHTSSQGAYATQ